MKGRLKPCRDYLSSDRHGQGGKSAPFLQYGVREGSEAGEAVFRLLAFIANCDSSFLLHWRCAVAPQPIPDTRVTIYPTGTKHGQQIPE